MKILIVSASLFEIRPFLEQLRFISGTEDRLAHYTHSGLEIDVLITGVGMVSTAYSLGRRLLQEHYSLVMNAGIAGAYPDELKIGTVVEVIEDGIGEMGVDQGNAFENIFDLGLADPNEFPYQEGRLLNVYPLNNNPVLEQLMKVKGNTVNRLTSDKKAAQRMQLISGAAIESMEGAAFLYACLLEKVRNIQIRSISNYVAERDKSKWDLKNSIRNLHEVMIRIIHNIS
jgi:futalosine hydrolase